MIIHGGQRGFKLTVGAAIRIAKLCPNGDLTQIDKLLDGGTDSALMTSVEMAAAMSEGYELAKKFELKDYEMNPLTVDEILSLDPNSLNELLVEALNAFKADAETMVAVKPSKKNRNK